jgi:hypothetical protein
LLLVIFEFGNVLRPGTLVEFLVFDMFVSAGAAANCFSLSFY